MACAASVVIDPVVLELCVTVYVPNDMGVTLYRDLSTDPVMFVLVNAVVWCSTVSGSITDAVCALATVYDDVGIDESLVYSRFSINKLPVNCGDSWYEANAIFDPDALTK